MKRKAKKNPIENEGFLNVDLEIWSRRKLDDLAAELADRVFVLYCGRKRSGYLLSVESSHCLERDLEKLICHLCKSIEGLSPHGKRLWNNARRRIFDIGVESPDGSRSLYLPIEKQTSLRIAAIDATIAISCYPKRNS